MSLVAEYVMQNVQRETRRIDDSHHLLVEGSHRPDGSFVVIQTEVTMCSLLDRGREAITDAMWELYESWVDDLCDPQHWRAAGPLLKG